MVRTQVLVIGGGPAGSTAARLLAANGFATLLIDRDFSFVKPCGGGVPAVLFQDLGIPEALRKKSVDRARIVSPKGDFIDMDLGERSIDIVERGEFERTLRALAEESGAELREAEFRRFTHVGKTMTAELLLREPQTSESPTGERDIPREPGAHHDVMQVQADYVVAADGVNSRVRSSLNIMPLPAFLTVSEKMGAEHTDLCEFWFGSSHAPHCYSWVFPQKEGITAGTGAFNRPGIKELWQTFVTRRGLKTQGRIRGYKVPQWQGDLFAVNNILFAGDAAGQVLPLTFEGIYYAMKSGELAARAITNGKVRDYKGLWEKKFKKEFLLMKRLSRHFLKGDDRAGRIVKLLMEPRVQEACLQLWIKRDLGRERMLLYLKIARGFLR